MAKQKETKLIGYITPEGHIVMNTKKSYNVEMIRYLLKTDYVQRIYHEKGQSWMYQTSPMNVPNATEHFELISEEGLVLQLKKWADQLIKRIGRVAKKREKKSKKARTAKAITIV